MKLYGHPLSSCTRKVLLAIAEKGADVDLVALDLFVGEHKQPAHLARHPFGVIPVLDDDGFVLFESRAILRYLDGRLPGPSLTPSAPRDRARMDQWLSVDQSYVAPHMQALVAQNVVRRHRGLAPEAEAISAARAGLSQAFGALDAALADRPLLAGGALSLADLSLMPYVGSLPLVGATDLLDAHPALSAWWSRVSDRPSWRAVAARA